MKHSASSIASKVAAAHFFLTTVFAGLGTIEVQAATVPDAEKTRSEIMAETPAQGTQRAADFQEEAKVMVENGQNDQPEQGNNQPQQDGIEALRDHIQQQEESAELYRQQLEDINTLYSTLSDAQWMDRIPHSEQQKYLNTLRSVDKKNNPNEIQSNITLIGGIYNIYTDKQSALEDRAVSSDFRHEALDWLADANAQRILDQKLIGVRLAYNKAILEAVENGADVKAEEIAQKKDETVQSFDNTLDPGERAILQWQHRIDYLESDIDNLGVEQNTLLEEYAFVETAEWRDLLPADQYNEMAAHEGLIEGLKEEVAETDKPAFKRNLEKRLIKEQQNFYKKEKELERSVKAARPQMLEDIIGFHEASKILEVQRKEQLKKAAKSLAITKEQVANGTFVEPEEQSGDVNLHAFTHLNETQKGKDVIRHVSPREHYKTEDARGNTQSGWHQRYKDEDNARVWERYREWNRTTQHRRGYNQSEGVYYNFHKQDPNIGHPFRKYENLRYTNRKYNSEWVSYNGYHGRSGHDIRVDYSKRGTVGDVETNVNILDVKTHDMHTKVKIGGVNINARVANPLIHIFGTPKPK